MPNTNKLPVGSPAEMFDRYMVPAIFAPWSEELLQRVSPQPGNRVLDVACGTGIVARTAAPIVGGAGRVAGLDMNASMLDQARTMDPLIDWREGDALALPFPEQEFDVVTCQQGLQFFPDRLKGIREMHRVLAPGGRLGIAIWCSMEFSPGYVALMQAVGRRVDEAASRLMDDAFCLTDLGEIRGLLENGGFRDVNVLRETKIARFASAEEFTRAIVIGSIMRRTGTQFSDATVQLLINDVTSGLQSYISADGLAFPMESHMATARK